MLRKSMRGADDQQNHIFSYLSPEERVRNDHPLRAIRAMVDEALTQLSGQLDAMYASLGGRRLRWRGCCELFVLVGIRGRKSRPN